MFFNFVVKPCINVFTDLLPLATDEGKLTKDFLQKLLEILFNHIKLQLDRNEKVIDFKIPTDLLENKGIELVFFNVFRTKKDLNKRKLFNTA